MRQGSRDGHASTYSVKLRNTLDEMALICAAKKSRRLMGDSIGCTLINAMAR